MSKNFICDIDIVSVYSDLVSMYSSSIGQHMPLYAKPLYAKLEQVPQSKYKDFRYKKSSFSDEYFLFGWPKKTKVSIRPLVYKLLNFSSENALLLTCEIYGIEVKEQK